MKKRKLPYWLNLQSPVEIKSTLLSDLFGFSKVKITILEYYKGTYYEHTANIYISNKRLVRK